MEGRPVLRGRVPPVFDGPSAESLGTLGVLEGTNSLLTLTRNRESTVPVRSWPDRKREPLMADPAHQDPRENTAPFYVRKPWSLFSILVALILLTQIAYSVAAMWTLDDWEVRGQFGDMFGAANTTFSGLALVGVIIAIVLQSRELELQREELKMTRRELKRAATAHEASSKLLSQQVKLTQVNLEASTSPVWKFVVRKFTKENGKCYIEVTNAGAPVHSVEVQFRGQSLSTKLEFPAFSRGETGQLQVDFPPDAASDNRRSTFVVHCVDRIEQEHRDLFRLNLETREVTRIGRLADRS